VAAGGRARGIECWQILHGEISSTVVSRRRGREVWTVGRFEITPLVRPRQASSMMSGVKMKAETKSMSCTEPASLPIFPSPPQSIGSSSFPHLPPCIPSVRHVSLKLNFLLSILAWHGRV
jgi:hypothetical protein